MQMPQQLGEDRFPLLYRRPPQVVAVELEQVEGTEDHIVTAPAPQQVEHRALAGTRPCVPSACLRRTLRPARKEFPMADKGEMKRPTHGAASGHGGVVGVGRGQS